MINQQEFPELGEIDGLKPASNNVSKKDTTNIGHFGSSIASGKAAEGGMGRPVQAQTEEKKEAKMPIFTRKIKVTTEASQNLENIPSKQNYDYSSLGLSSASTNKTAA